MEISFSVQLIFSDNLIMLNNLTFQYLMLSELAIAAISFAFGLAGALLAIHYFNREIVMGRVAYFAVLAIVSSMLMVPLILIVHFSIFLFSVQQIWVISGLGLLFSFVSGFFLTLVSIPRAQDAFENPGMAGMAIVPGGWLLLIFKRGIPNLFHRINSNILNGPLGILLGLIFSSATIFGAFVFVDKTTEYENFVQTDPSAQEINIIYAIQREGLESVLKTVAEETPVRQDDDGVLELVKTEAQEKVLTMTFKFLQNIDISATQLDTQIISPYCQNKNIRVLLEASATYYIEFFAFAGDLIHTVELNSDVCEGN